MNLKQLAATKRYGKGKSKAALRRRAEANRGTVLAGRPGDIVTDSRGVQYAVANDGSLRKGAA